MSDLLTYLLKANVALTLFYLGYKIGLEKLTFYKVNRYYLLLALIFSALYPFIALDQLFSQTPEIHKGLSAVAPNWQQIQWTEERMGMNEIFEGLFWLSIGLFALRLLVKLLAILFIHIKSLPAHWSVYTYRMTSDITSPFSFWKNIYLNPQSHSEAEYDSIFKHEYIHVKEFHTLDILVSEIILVLFWYNPFCWLLRKSVGENIEFVTDKMVLSSGINKQHYQYSLLNSSLAATKHPILGNHFNFKNLKKRIMMMNKKETSKRHIGKYAFIVPAIFIGLLIFSISNAYQSPAEKTLLNPFKSKAQPNPHATSPVTVEKRNQQPTYSRPPQDSLLNRTLTIRNTRTSDQLPTIFLDGKRITQKAMEEINVEDITEVNVYKGKEALEKFGEDGKNGVILMSTQNFDTAHTAVKEGENEIPEDALFLLDGKKITKKEMEEINPEDIKEVNVYKGKEALEKFGEDGKNGVIVITKKD